MTQPVIGALASGSLGDGTSPFVSPQSWDTIVIQGVPWYGKFEIRRAIRKHRWQVKESQGQDGADQTFRGRNPEPFSIKFYIWTDAMWTAWKTLSLLFQYSKGTSTPVSVTHPGLNQVGISAMLCVHLGVMEKQGDDLMWAVEVALRDYLPTIPINVTNTPAGAAATGAAGTPGLVPNPAIVALQAQIAKNDALISALGQPGGLPP